MVLLIPFLGALIFLLTGINRRKLKFLELKEIKRRKKRNKYSFHKEHFERSSQLGSLKAKKISRLAYSNTFKPLQFNNDVTVLNNGKETFKMMYEALEKAQSFIHMQYYIIEEGEVLENMYKIFQRKRNEGVEIRILYDTLGSFSLKNSTKKRLRNIGVEIYPIMPLKWGKFLFTINYRNHRKICVVDNQIAFTGGVNISNNYIKKDSELGIWQDAHVAIKGPAVNSVHTTFLEDYFFATSHDIADEDRYNEIPEGQGNSKVQIIVGGPDSDESVVMQQYLSFINLAEKSICIFNPYFIPTSTIIEALKIASLSGVKVSLLLPKATDSKIATYSMYSYFEELMSANINIYLRNDFSHSKVMFIDDEISSIGSTNFDCRSFEHNYEMNALIFDEKIAQVLREEFDLQCKNATKLNLEKFKNRSNKQKTLERLSRFLSPLL